MDPKQDASSMQRRGVFILLEGVDRCGKTTQTRLLQQALKSKCQQPTELLHFPERSSTIGTAIHAYLTNAKSMDDRAIHLLFAANRWESFGHMHQLLHSGVNIVMDRYSFSGVAFSAAKPDLSMHWCWQPEIGLIKPDAVIFLDIPIEKAAQRTEFGQERYETTDFQRRVHANFHRLIAQTPEQWHVLDATETIDQVHDKVMQIASKCLEDHATTPIQYFTDLPGCPSQ